jgi:hypothetical protein
MRRKSHHPRFAEEVPEPKPVIFIHIARDRLHAHSFDAALSSQLYCPYGVLRNVSSICVTIYSLQSTVYSLQSTVYSLPSTVYSRQSTVTVYSLQSTISAASSYYMYSILRITNMDQTMPHWHLHRNALINYGVSEIVQDGMGSIDLLLITE